jgi:hypothetical protein
MPLEVGALSLANMLASAVLRPALWLGRTRVKVRHLAATRQDTPIDYSGLWPKAKRHVAL